MYNVCIQCTYSCPYIHASCFRPWCETTLQEACQLLLSDLPLASNAPGGMPEYRCSLVTSFFFKFYLTVLSQLEGEGIPNEVISVTQPFKRDVARSTQGFQKVSTEQSTDDTIGRPVMHLSALKQAPGEARLASLHIVAGLPMGWEFYGTLANQSTSAQALTFEHLLTSDLGLLDGSTFNSNVQECTIQVCIIMCTYDNI